jgi:hypothetical protein
VKYDFGPFGLSVDQKNGYKASPQFVESNPLKRNVQGQSAENDVRPGNYVSPQTA